MVEQTSLLDRTRLLIDAAFEPRIVVEPIELVVPKTKTIQCFTRGGPEGSDDNLIFLVEESGDRDRHGNLLCDAGQPGKPPGWAMPGGAIKFKGLAKAMKYLTMQTYGENPSLTKELLEIIKDGEVDGIGIQDPMDYLTAIIEHYDEGGYVVLPVKWLFAEPAGETHEVHVIATRVIGGRQKKKSLETVDSGWFHLSRLPRRTYRSHVERIRQAVRKVGMDESIVDSELRIDTDAIKKEAENKQ